MVCCLLLWIHVQPFDIRWLQMRLVKGIQVYWARIFNETVSHSIKLFKKAIKNCHKYKDASVGSVYVDIKGKKYMLF